MNTTCQEVSEWMASYPTCFSGDRIVETAKVFDEYYKWASENDAIRHSKAALGLALKKLIPGIIGKQVKQGGVRFRVYVLPRTRPSDDVDDLL